MFGRKSGGKAKLKLFRLPALPFRLSFPEIHIPDFKTVLSFILNFDYRGNKKRILSAAGILSFIFCIMLVVDFIKVRELAEFTPDTTTRLYDRNGELISELFKEKRDVVKYEDMPQNLVNAFVAMEDNDFYSHIGINPKAIIRAMGELTEGYTAMVPEGLADADAARYVNRLMTHSWGQKVVRFYDPDGNLIEVGTPM